MTVRASKADILKAAQAIFAFRKASVTDPVAEHRHPMIYKDYKWDILPPSEQMYYCDMAASSFVSFGIACEDMPSFEHDTAAS